MVWKMERLVSRLLRLMCKLVTYLIKCFVYFQTLAELNDYRAGDIRYYDKQLAPNVEMTRLKPYR